MHPAASVDGEYRGGVAHQMLQLQAGRAATAVGRCFVPAMAELRRGSDDDGARNEGDGSGAWGTGQVGPALSAVASRGGEGIPATPGGALPLQPRVGVRCASRNKEEAI